MNAIAEMNEVIERAIDLEERTAPSPRVVEKLPVVGQNLWGFQVPDEVLVSEARDKLRRERLVEIKHYRDNALKVTRDLHDLDIEPLAVMTTKAWHEILRRSGLFVVDMQPDGHTYVSTKLVRQLKTSAHPDRWGFVGAVVALALSVWPIMKCFAFGWEPVGALFASAFVLGFAISATVCAANIIKAVVDRHTFEKRVDRYIATHSWQEFLRDVQGDGKFLGHHEYNDGNGSRMWAKMQLPQPPVSAVQTLRKLYRNGQARRSDANYTNIRVAAEADAIGIAGGMREYFKTGYDVLVSEEVRLRADPILFIDYKGVTAVIDQWGDFPIERKVIEEVAQSEYLL